MMRKSNLFFAAAVAMFFVSAPSSLAQLVHDGNQTGLPPFGSFHGSNFDLVSVVNGNLHVEIPIISLSQRGGRVIRTRFVYDIPTWQVYWIPLPPSDPGAPGYWVLDKGSDQLDGTTKWRLSTEGLSGWKAGYTYTEETCTNPPYMNYYVFSNYTITDSDGTKHQVPLRKEASSTPCLGQVLTGPALDGSGLVAELDPSSQFVTKVKFKNGTQNNLDSNGNTADVLGRIPVVVSTLPNGSTQWTVKDSNGNPQVYTLEYTTRSINVDSFCTMGPRTSPCYGLGTFNESVPWKLTLPNGKQYIFTWDGSGTNMGDLARIDLPTGGYITYTYGSLKRRPAYSERYSTYNARRKVVTRTVFDGTQPSTWTYSAGYNAATITQPSYNGAQNQEVHELSYEINGLTSDSGIETKVRYYAGSAATGTLLRTVQKEYTAETSPLTGGAANVRLIRETTTLDNNLVSKVETDYETFTYTYVSNIGWCYTCTGTRLNVTERREYAYASGIAGPLVRKTSYGYLHTNNQPYLTRNIVDRVNSVVVRDGSSNIVAQSTNDYDIYTYSDMGAMQASNAFNHDGTNYGISFIYRGSVTATKRWRNTDGAWLETRHQYDDAGNILKTRDPLSHFTWFDYSDNWSNATCAPAGNGKLYLKSATNALGHVTSYSYNSCRGTIASTTDPNSQTTTFSYDFMNRPDITNLPDGGQVTQAYSDLTDPPPFRLTTSIKNTAFTYIYSKATFDALGRVSRSELCENGASSCTPSIKTDTAYDSLGRVLTVTNPYRSTSDSTYGITKTKYDALSRTTRVIPPDGNEGADTNVIKTDYLGNTVTVTDQVGKQRRSYTDALGRLIQVDEPNPTLSTPATTTYTYDTLDNLTQVLQSSSRQRTFTYNSLSQLTQATNPESGTINYTYDNDGNLLTKTDARGIQVNYSPTDSPIDALHRVTKKTYSNGDPAVSYFYDQTSYNGLTIGNGKGRRTGMSDAAGLAAWSYDITLDVGWKTTEKRTINGITKTTIQQNNLAGSLAQLTYPSGTVMNYGYDNAGRATSGVDTANNYAQNASYAPQGAIASVLHGQVAGGFGGITLTQTYNNRLQPSTIVAASTNGTVIDFAYSFNNGTANNGNVASIANNRDTTRSLTFTYDELNRIKSAVANATSGPNCWGQLFGHMDGGNFVSGYDIWANMKEITPDPSRPACGVNPLGLTINTLNRIADPNYQYDAAGNLTYDPPNFATYQYDAENRMKSASGTLGSAAYTYDGDGKRVWKAPASQPAQPNKLYWHGMGSDALDETDGAGNTNNASFNEYVFFNGKRIARRDFSNNVNYYFTDHLGTSRVQTTAAGAICYDADYYPFGGERVVTDTCPQNYKFTGKERDSESGLDNFGFRYNSSSLGRFMSPDPLMASGRVENPQTWNRYTYALNNPLRFIDPFGLFASPAFNCTDTNKNCLNAQQREILNNSTGKDKDGNTVSGEALYNSLNEKQQNAFVNVTDRLASIKFEDGTTALSAVKSVTSFEPDRIKATVDSALAGKIEGDSRFQPASGALHPGFGAISFKSKDVEGNIQFSFSQTRTGVDIDHDLYQDWRHAGEVLWPGKTNQDAVRRLLIARPEVAITPSPDPKFNRPEKRP